MCVWCHLPLAVQHNGTINKQNDANNRPEQISTIKVAAHFMAGYWCPHSYRTLRSDCSAVCTDSVHTPTNASALDHILLLMLLLMTGTETNRAHTLVHTHSPHCDHVSKAP